MDGRGSDGTTRARTADPLTVSHSVIVEMVRVAALEVPVEWHVSRGLGHGIDAEGLRQGGEFLTRRFRAVRPASPA